MWICSGISGPVLGGFLAEHLHWSAIFWINLPIGTAVFVMFSRFLQEHQRPRRHRIDYLGSALMVLGAGGIMLALAAFFLTWVILSPPPPITTAEMEAARKAREEFGTQGPPTH